jgi:hypothetical protein
MDTISRLAKLVTHAFWAAMDLSGSWLLADGRRRGSREGLKGLYTFGSQRFWRIHPDSDNSGISGFSSLVLTTLA